MANFGRQVTLAVAKLVAEGKATPPKIHLRYPGRARPCPAGYVRRLIRIHRPDGASLDAREARRLLPEELRAISIHNGQANGWHLFDHDPRKVRRR